jgi:hypothetical protein
MAVSFATNVVPMFTQMDIQHMNQQGIHLDQYEYMSDSTDNHANANAVYQEVSSGAMPPSWSGEKPWTKEMVQLFQQWMTDGYQP